MNHAADGDTRTGDVRVRHVMLHSLPAGRKSFISVQFPAAYQVGQNVLWPTCEGNVQDATVIDRHGDPDLMLEFAEQYFKLYNATVPAGRLPARLVEIMPALHLLVTAAELAFKAYLTRDGKDASGHSLEKLYKELDPAHRNRIDTIFSKSYLNTNLTVLGVEPPKVEDILRTYDSTYGSSSGVYMDSRYYAEPTTRFKRGHSLHGANLAKGNTPYPTFLPEIVSAQINTYQFFWGLVPSSLGLCVVSVPQRAGISAEDDALASFEKLSAEHSPGMRTGWKYGGNTLLFYEVGEQSPTDGHATLNGVPCRVWRHQRVGMHARDLYSLANRLEEKVPFGSLSDVRIERNEGH